MSRRPAVLDQLLVETLDPSYVEAARARQRAAGAAGRPQRRSARRLGRLTVALTLAAAGVLAAVAYDQAAAGARGRDEVRQALIADIERESETTDALAAELEQLRSEVTDARGDALAATAIGQQALDELARAEVAAAVVPVTGPGLEVTLADAGPDADGDPVGGSGEGDPRGQVHDGDLQLVVNALWAAGAEAVGINGQRLGPTTAIRFAGEAVLVDFRPVTSPYVVRAIGDPAALRSRFLASPQVAGLAAVSESFGLRFQFSEEDDLSLPAWSSLELRSAEPLSDGAGPAAGSAPDPSPGG